VCTPPSSLLASQHSISAAQIPRGGAEIEIDTGNDGAGGIYVSWSFSGELTEEISGYLFPPGRPRPILAAAADDTRRAVRQGPWRRDERERAARRPHLQRAEADFDPLQMRPSVGTGIRPDRRVTRGGPAARPPGACDALIAATAMAHGLPVDTCHAGTSRDRRLLRGARRPATAGVRLTSGPRRGHRVRRRRAGRGREG
jgi:predicted nucleic acid-binding protein